MQIIALPAAGTLFETSGAEPGPGFGGLRMAAATRSVHRPGLQRRPAHGADKGRGTGWGAASIRRPQRHPDKPDKPAEG